MKTFIGFIALFIALVGFPCNVQAQFWSGFLQGLNQGIQNYSRQQSYNRQQSYTKKQVSELHKDVQKEDDGFIWTKVRTWNGTKSINYGAQDENGNTLIPQKYDLICYQTTNGGWFNVTLKDKEGVYTKGGHCICDAIYDNAVYREEGDDIYVEVEQNGKTGILDKNGNYIISPSSAYKFIFYSSTDKVFKYEDSAGEYVSTGIDIHGNHVYDNKMDENIAKTQTTARTDNSNNPNNNKFWYDKYVNGKMDSQGNPIKTSLKYMYPCDGANMFEIEFVYKDNNSMPVSVYLNEIAKGGKIVKSELIAAPFKSVASSVKYKTNSVDIFSPKYHIHISSSGDVIIYDTNKGSYANGNTRYFKAGNAEPIYKVRYEVLIRNLKKYF